MLLLSFPLLLVAECCVPTALRYLWLTLVRCSHCMQEVLFRNRIFYSAVEELARGSRPATGRPRQ